MSRPPSAAATVLAFDFGTRRIGVAVGDLGTRIAHPLATIERQKAADRFAAIAALIDEWRPAHLVVGLPTHADGTGHELTERARRFARQLEGRHGLPVALVDERWSTEVAQMHLNESGARGRKGRAVRDRVAAQIILQSFLDDGPRAP